MTDDPVVWLRIAATEPQTLLELEGCVQRLRDVQAAKQALADLPPNQLRAALLQRRAGEHR